jgi:hypothetical protein
MCIIDRANPMPKSFVAEKSPTGILGPTPTDIKRPRASPSLKPCAMLTELNSNIKIIVFFIFLLLGLLTY